VHGEKVTKRVKVKVRSVRTLIACIAAKPCDTAFDQLTINPGSHTGWHTHPGPTFRGRYGRGDPVPRGPRGGPGAPVTSTAQAAGCSSPLPTSTLYGTRAPCRWSSTRCMCCRPARRTRRSGPISHSRRTVPASHRATGEVLGRVAPRERRAAQARSRSRAISRHPPFEAHDAALPSVCYRVGAADDTTIGATAFAWREQCNLRTAWGDRGVHAAATSLSANSAGRPASRTFAATPAAS
jgi:hypothetical protein